MSYTEEYKRILHRMGYYDYQQGIIYRHLNQEGGWNLHLERCRKYILRAVDNFKPDKITVLGSGWLLDLPLAEMIEKTERIVLADIVHPPEVIKQVSAFKNVELLEADLTGGLIGEVWAKTRKYGLLRRMHSLDDIEIPEFIPSQDPGLVISLNILTQLETLPVKLLKTKSDVTVSEYEIFRKKIQEKHLSFLACFRSVLISDACEIYSGRKGTVRNVPTLLAEIPACSSKEEWTWNFDVIGSDYHNQTSVMNVIAVTFG